MLRRRLFGGGYANLCGDRAVAEVPITKELLLRPLDSLGLGRKICWSLKREHYDNTSIVTVGEVIGYTAEDLLERRNFGVVALRVLREKLAALGVHLKGDPVAVPPVEE